MYEIALVSSSKARLETLVSKGNKSARGVLKQLEEPEKFLSTIQIGITLIGIVSGAFGGVAIADDVTPLFAMIPGLEAYARNLAMITTVAVITYLSLIVAEIHRTEQSGTICHNVQPHHDPFDQSLLSFRMAVERFYPTSQQTHRTEKRRTHHDTGRTENDSSSKLRAGSDR